MDNVPPQAGGCPVAADLFQYISCCSLSPPSYVSGSHQQGFNTSHVVVYRRLPAKSGTGNFSFNTSHVVVYLFPGCINICLFQFQYISCCSLSGSVRVGALRYYMFQYISCCSLSRSLQSIIYSVSGFNTSHVVVYHDTIANRPNGIKFQYISCCSLSDNEQ